VDSRLKCNRGASISESLVRGQEAEAFARGIVVALDAGLELGRGEGGEISFAREVAAHAADGVFDAAFLPRFVGIAEEGGEAEVLGELVVGGELGAVIEGEGLAQGRGEGLEESEQAVGDGLGGFVGRARRSSREERSCTTRTAWPYLRKSMRSASPWPGTERSWAWAGR